jgi:hypothetical protein
MLSQFPKPDFARIGIFKKVLSLAFSLWYTWDMSETPRSIADAATSQDEIEKLKAQIQGPEDYVRKHSGAWNACRERAGGEESAHQRPAIVDENLSSIAGLRIHRYRKDHFYLSSGKLCLCVG